MLGYCAYELSFPGVRSFEHTAIFWGEILRCNSPLEWAIDERGEFCPLARATWKFRMYPQSRLMEIMHPSTTQFDQFHILTEQVYLEMVDAFHGTEELSDFTALIAYIRQSSD